MQQRTNTAAADVSAVARRALALYGCSSDAEISILDVSENATFKVHDPTRNTTFVLRVHRLGYHTHEEVLSELDWIEALSRDAGIRTAAVIRAGSGKRVVSIDVGEAEPRLCVAFEYLPGTAPPYNELPRRFADLGAITARMHLHALTWRRPPGFARFAWDFDAAFGAAPRWGDWRDGLGAGPDERVLLQRLETVIRRRVSSYGMPSDRYGLIHADLRLANLLVDREHIAVIDFDDCGWGWFVYDLAAALSFIEDSPAVPELVESWLSGYQQVRTLTAEDTAEIRTFILFRRLLLTAWIGSHAKSVEFARSLGPGFTDGTCALAEDYLRTHN